PRRDGLLAGRHPAGTAVTLRPPTVAVLAAAFVAATFPASTDAAKAKVPRRPTVVAVATPLGLQGIAGGDGNVLVAFRLFDRRRRPSEIEAQYGLDLN